MMLLSDSVGGAEASRNGFSNRKPVNVVARKVLIEPIIGITSVLGARVSPFEPRPLTSGLLRSL
jgi:hypothetical protein